MRVKLALFKIFIWENKWFLFIEFVSHKISCLLLEENQGRQILWQNTVDLEAKIISHEYDEYLMCKQIYLYIKYKNNSH